jgi:small GTP-binding protein
MESTFYDHILKILIIGDSGTGKTSLSSRFYDRSFTDFYSSTIGIDFRVKTVKVDGETIKLQIWDTSGNDRFKFITSVYYKNADGFIILYDVYDQQSFANVSKWMDQIYKFLKIQHHTSFDSFKKNIILVGNKIDLNYTSKIKYGDGKELADQLGIHFIEASVKQNINVKEIFDILTQNMLSTRPPTSIMIEESHSINLLNHHQVKHRKKYFNCC